MNAKQCSAAGFIGLVLLASSLHAQESAGVVSAVRCADKEAKDQDDMCIWVHPTDRAQSLVITADKAANKVFVYDLAGKTVQSIPAKRPGNIDVRYGFSLGREEVDVVAFNGRAENKIFVYRVDPDTRRLERV